MLAFVFDPIYGLAHCPPQDFGDIIDLLSKAVPGRKSGLTINSGVDVYPI